MGLHCVGGAAVGRWSDRVAEAHHRLEQPTPNRERRERLCVCAHVLGGSLCHARLVKSNKSPSARAKTIPVFDAQAFLDSAGGAKTVIDYARGESIFAQGDDSQSVLYIQSGGVKLSVLSKN